MVWGAGIHADSGPGGSGDREAKTITGRARGQEGLEQHPALCHTLCCAPQNPKHSAAELLHGSTALRQARQNHTQIEAGLIGSRPNQQLWLTRQLHGSLKRCCGEGGYIGSLIQRLSIGGACGRAEMTSDGRHRTPGVMHNPLLTSAGFLLLQPTAAGVQASQALPLKTPAQRAGLGRESPLPEAEIPELQLARAGLAVLQMLSEDLDELMRRYVFHSVYVLVQQREVLLHEEDRETLTVRLTSILARRCDFY